MPTYTLSALIVFLLLLFGVYVVHQARRSRESEMAFKLRKCEIALQDAEHALSNTIDFYKSEVARLERQLAGQGPDAKFRRAKSAFARRYHPDRVTGDGEESRIRTEIFKEFWEELQHIEASGRSAD